MKSPDSSQVTSVQAFSLVKSDERFHSSRVTSVFTQE